MRGILREINYRFYGEWETIACSLLVVKYQEIREVFCVNINLTGSKQKM